MAASNNSETWIVVVAAGIAAYLFRAQLAQLITQASPAATAPAAGSSGGGIGPTPVTVTAIPDPTSVVQPVVSIVADNTAPPQTSVTASPAGTNYQLAQNQPFLNTPTQPATQPPATAPPADPTANISLGIWGSPAYGVQSGQQTLISQVATALAAQGIDPSSATPQQVQAVANPILQGNSSAALASAKAAAGLHGIPRATRQQLRPRWVRPR